MRKKLLLLLCPLAMFLAASTGQAGVKDYLALIDGDSNVFVRWGMIPVDPYANSAMGSLSGGYPELKKWMRESPDLDFRDDGFSVGSGAVLTGCASPEDSVAAGLQTKSPVKYFPETTMEIIFSPQEIPKDLKTFQYIGWAWQPPGRFSPLAFQENTHTLASRFGVGNPEQAWVPWNLTPEAGHWYYVVIQLQFGIDRRVGISVYAADLASGEKSVREVAKSARRIESEHFIEKGVPLRIGLDAFSSGVSQAGENKSIEDISKKAPPTLFDEIIISKGLLTEEQMNERLAALLKP